MLMLKLFYSLIAVEEVLNYLFVFILLSVLSAPDETSNLFLPENEYGLSIVATCESPYVRLDGALSLSPKSPDTQVPLSLFLLFSDTDGE